MCKSRLGILWGPGGGLWLTAVWDEFGYEAVLDSME